MDLQEVVTQFCLESVGNDFECCQQLSTKGEWDLRYIDAYIYIAVFYATHLSKVTLMDRPGSDSITHSQLRESL